MPNRLAQFKRRQSLAEHAAVLAALSAIALRERTTVMALLREAARDAVRKRAAQPARVAELRIAVAAWVPRMPPRFKTAAQLARFKRSQREFDQVMLDLALAAPKEVQARNSVVPLHQRVRLINFDQAHAAST
jgi:hypothetical protein